MNERLRGVDLRTLALSPKEAVLVIGIVSIMSYVLGFFIGMFF